jgi:hypothetical protein
VPLARFNGCEPCEKRENAEDTMSNKQIQSWDWDVRVRERNLRKGMLDEDTVSKHLAKLPDVAEQSDPVSVGQPALGGRED